MKILPKINPQTRWYTQFDKRLKHMKWIKECKFEDVKYLYEMYDDPERAAIQYIADRYNRLE